MLLLLLLYMSAAQTLTSVLFSETGLLVCVRVKMSWQRLQTPPKELSQAPAGRQRERLYLRSLRTMLAAQMVRALFFLFFRPSRGDSDSNSVGHHSVRATGCLVLGRASGGKQESFELEAADVCCMLSAITNLSLFLRTFVSWDQVFGLNRLRLCC